MHPFALTRYDQLETDDSKAEIDRLTQHHENRTDYFVEQLSWGIATIAARSIPIR